MGSGRSSTRRNRRAPFAPLILVLSPSRICDHGLSSKPKKHSEAWICNQGQSCGRRGLTSGDRPGRLLFVIHHLAVDAVSWRILMEDSWHAYECLARPEVVVLPEDLVAASMGGAVCTSTHSQRVCGASCGTGSRQPRLGAGRVPVDLLGVENIAAAARTVTVELDEESTRSLVDDTPKAYQTQINDTLLTALAQVLAAWTGETRRPIRPGGAWAGAAVRRHRPQRAR